MGERAHRERARERAGAGGHTPEPKKVARARAALNVVPSGTAATPAERGFAECPCTEDCPLHGSCLLCTAYHGRKSRLPRCERGVTAS
jgi:hypothetical protein